MVRKFSMVLFFAVLFGLLTTVSVFAGPRPPNGRYVETQYNRGTILLHYMPARQLWEISIFDNRGNLQGSYETRDFDDSTNYIIRFRHNNANCYVNWSSNTLYVSLGGSPYMYRHQP